jgi:hypothetical protein
MATTRKNKSTAPVKPVEPVTQKEAKQPKPFKASENHYNGPRVNRDTGATNHLEHSSAGWLVICDTHATHSANLNTRAEAKALRARTQDFCAACKSIIEAGGAKALRAQQRAEQKAAALAEKQPAAEQKQTKPAKPAKPAKAAKAAKSEAAA